MSASPSRVYVHIGPPKTGTTYLQAVLWKNRARLAERGIVLPGSRAGRHFVAALDLRDLDFKGHVHAARAGAWRGLVKNSGTSPGDASLISHELFAGCTPDQMTRMVRDLVPSEVHIVYGARDFARQIPAAWQESVKNGVQRSYAQHLTRSIAFLRDGDLDRGMWRAQHHAAVLRRWQSVIPAERIHVITLPRQGAPPDLLWRRLCQVLQLEPDGFETEVGESNASLSAEETEVLRLVNKAVPDGTSWPTYDHRIKRRFNARANTGGSRGTPLTVPKRLQADVCEHAAADKKALGAEAYDIVGSLDDLDPVDASFGPDFDFADPAVAETAGALLARELLRPGPGPRTLKARLRRRLPARLVRALERRR